MDFETEMTMAANDALQPLVNALCQPEVAEAWSPQLDSCRNCRRQLGWPIIRDEVAACPVECPACGNWYYCRGRNRTRVRLNCETSVGKAKPRTTEEPDQRGWAGVVLDRLIGRKAATVEQRRTVRHPINRSVVVVPLDLDGKPTREAVAVMLDDLSLEGVRMTLTSNIDSDLFLLDFTAVGFAGLQMIAEVVWRKSLPTGASVGGRFLHPFGDALPLSNA